MKRVLLVIVALICLSPGVSFAGKILAKSDFTYLGAFRVPQGTIGGADLKDSNDANYKPLAYNSERNSLFIGSYTPHEKTFELSIPTLVKSDSLTSLNTAGVLQGPVDLTAGNLDNLGLDGSSIVPEGTYGQPWGLLEYNGYLLGTAWAYYDASGTNGWRSHFTAARDNWSTAVQFQGMYKVGVNVENASKANGGFVGGYMASIPTEWQTALGGMVLTGRSGGPIVSRSSYGPSLWSIDPSALGVADPTPANVLVAYPESHKTLGDFTDEPNLFYNRANSNISVVFPVGSDSVLVFGNGAVGIELDANGVPVEQAYSCTGAGTSISTEAKSNAWLLANSPGGYTCGYTELTASDITGGAACCYDPANTASSGSHTYSYTIGTGQTCYGKGTTSLAEARSNAWLVANSPSGWVCGDGTTSSAEITAGDSCCYTQGPLDKGPKGFPYVYQVWQYAASDLAAVKAGTMNYWDVVPTVWFFDLPFAPAVKKITGVAYDQSTQKIYIAQSFGDGNYPLIHGFQMDLTPYPVNDGLKVFLAGSWQVAPLKAYISGSWQTPNLKVYKDGTWKTWVQGSSEYELPTSSAVNTNNSVTWEGNVGIPGDIPNYTTIYTTLSPGGNIQAAIDGANTAYTSSGVGQVVKLNAGTYTVGTTIQLKSGVVLRGAGIQSTILSGTLSTLVGFGTTPGYGTSYTLLTPDAGSTLAKGSTTISTNSAHGWSVGDIVLIDQLEASGDNPPVITDYGGRNNNRPVGQFVRVTGIPTSTSATIEIPTYWPYNAARTPQVTKINTFRKLAGIEELTIHKTGGTASDTNGTVTMFGTDRCWLYKTEIRGSYTNLVLLRHAYRNVIRSCIGRGGVPETPLQGSPQYDTSRAYGIRPNFCSASLFENNELYWLTMGFQLDRMNSGNVYAYNYLWGGQYAPSSSWQVDSFRIHEGHPYMNLIEGNYVRGTMKFDNTHGTSSHNTIFRNKVDLETSRTNSAQDINFYNTVYYNNVIGNVLGTNGFETSYQTTAGSGTKGIYGISGTDNHIRHANWDYVRDSITYNGTDEQNLPDSMYLSSKPSWMKSGTRWPLIGPDLSPMVPTAPTQGAGTPF